MTRQPPEGPDDRPLPFVLRVAAEWVRTEDLPRVEDGGILFRRRAGLTGDLIVTDQGRDIQFSDLEVQR